MNSRILIVEDDPDILFILQFILCDNGYEVFTSPDGENIIDKVNHLQPDLILMDILLPNADGRELCEKIRRNNSFPIILMSANQEYSLSTPEACANDFIAKPFDLDDVIKRVHAQLAA